MRACKIWICLALALTFVIIMSDYQQVMSLTITLNAKLHNIQSKGMSKVDGGGEYLFCYVVFSW